MKELQFLRQDECHEWAGAVMRLAPYAIDQGGFYTLGMPAYIADKEQYAGLANTYNAMLIQNFNALYEGLRSVLSEHFDTPVGYFNDGGLRPSFHIFDSLSVKREASIHIDEQYENVIALEGREWKDPFTLTVPIMLPEGVNGLDMWPEGALTSEPPTELIEYTPGKMYIHSGAAPHRIHKPETFKGGAFRITLQAHGVHTPAGVVLYW